MRLASLCICVLLLSVARPVFAQSARPEPLSDYFFPSELLLNHAQEIGISDAQKEAIESKVREHRKQFVELQQILQKQTIAMAELLRKPNPDESQALEQLDKLLAAEREIKRMQLSLGLEIRKELTPEQIATAKALRRKYAAEAHAAPAFEGIRARMQRLQDRIRTLQQQGQDASKEQQAAQQVRELVQDGKTLEAEGVLRRALGSEPTTSQDQK